MFTGIVEEIGEVLKLQTDAGGHIEPAVLPFSLFVMSE